MNEGRITEIRALRNHTLRGSQQVSIREELLTALEEAQRERDEEKQSREAWMKAEHKQLQRAEVAEAELKNSEGNGQLMAEYLDLAEQRVKELEAEQGVYQRAMSVDQYILQQRADKAVPKIEQIADTLDDAHSLLEAIAILKGEMNG